jgi:hypothetical protein
MENGGVAAQAYFLLSVTPTAGDLVNIGADTYEFGGTGSNINVTIGGSATNARNNLSNAINSSGTETVYASAGNPAYNNSIRIQYADSPGGSPKVGPTTIALDSTMASGSNKWNCESLESSAIVPKMHGLIGKVTVDATMLATDSVGTYTLQLPPMEIFPQIIRWAAYAPGGQIKTTTARVDAGLGGPPHTIRFELGYGATPLVPYDFIVWEIINDTVA